ncbi:MAG: CAP domain-containing protein [Candidatus Velamenicoccus archaeovorus]
MPARAVRRGSVGLVTVLLLAGVLLSGTGPDRAGAGEITRRERMLSLTNEVREQHRRADLRLNMRLSRYAKRHSLQMARAGHLFHSDTSVLTRALQPFHWSIGGENVGVGSSVESLQDAFMASPTHRENILRPSFDHTAIGMVRVGGRLWVTVVFYG